MTTKRFPILSSFESRIWEAVRGELERRISEATEVTWAIAVKSGLRAAVPDSSFWTEDVVREHVTNPDMLEVYLDYYARAKKIRSQIDGLWDELQDIRKMEVPDGGEA